MSKHRFKSAQRFEKKTGVDHTSGVNPNGAAWETWKNVYKTIIADVELEIDIEGLMRRLGGRAVNSKARKSAALHGLVRAKIVGERDAC